MSTLFEDGKLGDLQVKNRVFMAPLTRNRAHPDGTPHEMAIKYYEQRAGAGLIVSEATQVNPIGKGVINTPGIHNAKHAGAWGKITDAVHAKDGNIVLQLWHVGRVSHTSLLPEGAVPLAPSPIRANTQTGTADGQKDVSDPRAMSVSEIKETIADYVSATRLAVEAGFDGVEVHGANGYLLNQFISTNSNQRDDDYGGSSENRSRLLLEIVDAVSKEIGRGKVGVRLSPTGTYNDIHDEQAAETYAYLYAELDKRNLAYLHIVEKFPGREPSEKDAQLIQNLRRGFQGNYIANGGYDKLSAIDVLEDGAFAVAFGRPFISNPDLPERLKRDIALADLDGDTIYGGDETGYSDYPALSEEAVAA